MTTDRPPLVIVYAPGSPDPGSILASVDDVVAPCFVALSEYTGDHQRDGFAPADVLFVASDMIDRAAEWAREHHAAGIVTYSELALRFTARLAERLGLPHHPTRAADAMTDKLAQRVMLRAAGVPAPDFAEIRHAGDVDAAAAAVGFPAVLKPRHGMGSTLVTRVNGVEELREGVTAALRDHDADYRLSHSDTALVLEEQIQGASWHEDERLGDYVSVESVIDRGRIVHLAVTDKLPLVPSFRETGNVMPSSLDAPRRAQVEATATAALRAVGAYHGAAHTEIKMTADGPRVIEVNGRLGGSLEYPIRMSSGFDAIRAIALIAVGRGGPDTPRFTRVAMNYFVPPTLGDQVIAAIDGLDEVSALDGVQFIARVHGVGDRVDTRFGTDAAIVIVLAVAEDTNAILDLRDTIDKTLSITYA